MAQGPDLAQKNVSFGPFSISEFGEFVSNIHVWRILCPTTDSLLLLKNRLSTQGPRCFRVLGPPPPITLHQSLICVTYRYLRLQSLVLKRLEIVRVVGKSMLGAENSQNKELEEIGKVQGVLGAFSLGKLWRGLHA